MPVFRDCNVSVRVPREPRFPVPDCAVCGHPAERVCCETDIVTDEFVITVRCHGATEVIKIRNEVFLDRWKLKTQWIAFVPALPAQGAIGGAGIKSHTT